MWKFSIFVKQPADSWQGMLLDRTRVDARIIEETEEGRTWLVFCDDGELAQIERWRMEQGGEISATYCYMSLRDGRIQVNREGSSASSAVLSNYGQWILAEFPIEKVLDDENGIEITVFAVENPDAMFGDSESA